jgi:hypothetical protein
LHGAPPPQKGNKSENVKTEGKVEREGTKASGKQTPEPIQGKSKPPRRRLVDTKEWCDELEAISTIPKEEWTFDNIATQFQHVKLASSGVNAIDNAMQSFYNILELDMSGNFLSVIENLPGSLEVFNAYDNRVQDFRVMGLPSLMQYALPSNPN